MTQDGCIAQVLLEFLEGFLTLVHPTKCLLQCLEEGQTLFFAFEMNLLCAAILPVSFRTSFTILGDAISSMASTFSGFASIPF